MTVLVHPDGQALLMIGNQGGAVKATFNLSGLGYDEFTVTDIYSGNALAANPKLVVNISRHGYALLKIEKRN